MSSFDLQRQEALKRRWQESHKNSTSLSSSSSNFYSKLVIGTNTTSSVPLMGKPRNLQTFPGGFDDDLVSAVVPPVTVVLEGRSICQRISLDKHSNYESLAKALRQMFVDIGDCGGGSSSSSSIDSDNFDLSNAIPGHLIAYEDMQNDLLLVGDLNWNDFVKVAKRMRIIPVKSNSRSGKVEN